MGLGVAVLLVAVVAAIVGLIAQPLDRYALAVGAAELRATQTPAAVVLVVVQWTVLDAVAPVGSNTSAELHLIADLRFADWLLACTQNFPTTYD